MSNRSIALMTALLELHQVQEPEALPSLLLRRMAPEYGRAVAGYYITDELSGDFRLQVLSDTSGRIGPQVWENLPDVPHSLPRTTAAPALERLAAADPVTLTAPLASLLDGLWPRDTAERVQQALGIRFAAVSPVRMPQGPAGLVLILPRDTWPVLAAAECAAHVAAALARLLERRLAMQPGVAPFLAGMIDQVAAREVNRAQRYGRLLSLAVLAQDEDPPSPEGQHALAALAMRVMRQPDTAGHLDHGRVVVLLPETGADGAAVFLRRVHQAAGPDAGEIHGACATLPDDGGTLERLVAAAAGRLAPLRTLAARDPDTVADGSHAAEARTAPSGGAAGARAGAAPTVRMRIAPLSDEEIAHWQSLLRRLPAVLSAQACGFDGFAGTFDVRTPSVTRLLTELQQLASKVGAELTPTITGEVGFTFRPEGAPRKGQPARTARRGPDGGLSSSQSTGTHRFRRLPHASGSAGRPGRWMHRVAALVIVGALVPAGIFAASVIGRDRSATAPAVSAATPGAAVSAGPEDPAATPSAHRLLRDLTGKCLPEPGKAECDALRAGLWSGDIVTWQRWAALRGEPVPTPDDVSARTIAMRAAANDPATRINVARGAGQALPMITALDISSEEGRQRVVGLEIANLGAAAADMAGVVLPGELGRFAPGSSLVAGQRCAIGPAVGAPACPLVATGVNGLDVTAGDHLRLMSAGGRELDDFVVPAGL